MSIDISMISRAINDAIQAREFHKQALIDLRVIAVEMCGFDQEVMQKSNPIDVLDGFIKGYMRNKS